MARWTPAEETILKDLYDAGVVNPKISLELNRSVDSIQKKLQQKGWTHRGSGQYSRNSDKPRKVKKMSLPPLNETEAAQQIAEYLRTKGATKCPDRFATPTITGLTRNQERTQMAAIQLKKPTGRWKSKHL